MKLPDTEHEHNAVTSTGEPVNREGFYRTLMSNAPDAIYVLDLQGQIQQANAAARSLTGLTRIQLQGMHFQHLSRQSTEAAFRAQLQAMLDEHRSHQVFESRHLHRGCALVPVEVNLAVVEQAPEPLFLAIVRNISERVDMRRRLEHRLAFNQMLLSISARLVNLAPEALDEAINRVLADIGQFFAVDRTYVFVIDEQQQTHTNTHEWTAPGVSPEIERLQNLPLSAFRWLVPQLLQKNLVHVPDVAALPDSAQGERQEWQREGIQSIVLVPIVRSGETRGFIGMDAVREARCWNDETRDDLQLLAQMIGSAMDATRLGRDLRHLAFHDSLTGLPNRKMLDEHIARSVARCQRSGHKLAVMLLDLDDFKLVNDSLGHHAGDELLCQIANRLKRVVRDGDIVARIGGDEFVLALEVLDSDEVAGIAERSMLALGEPMQIRGHAITTHPSIGISLHPDDDTDHLRLLRNADLAMYAAKNSGKNRYAFFDPLMSQRSRALLGLRCQIEAALGRDQFSLYFQPRVDLATGQVCALEALLRWQHPDRGLMLPADFLHLAKRSDLICRIDRWVVATACALQVAWQPGKDLTLTINVGARNIHTDTQRKLLIECLRECREQGQGLELDISETVIAEDPDLACLHLQAIREALPCVQIALGNFGMGGVSLHHLGKLPVNTLKIDRTLVADLNTEDHTAGPVIGALVTMAHQLDMRVVAEGCETAAQLNALAAVGCDEVQGHLFSPALAQAHVPALLAAWRT